ncbi:protein LBH-like [Megalobrama amblycephala]|uniref:protein LBH-like n=1 Tax=Megalobrama amblycephala TaxID=75352 RepID=UPI002014692E|nr:protein LBH-like [Megalobrama amblycephala]
MSKGPQDSSMEQLRLQRREEQTSYQIFPEPSEQMKGAARLKERLPSIVVEPSEESGEQNSVVDEEEEEEEDPFQDRCDPAGSGQEEQADVDRVPRFKRSSIPCIQIDYSRLTPPPSPTSSRAAPPCFRS